MLKVFMISVFTKILSVSKQIDNGFITLSIHNN